ncbi:MAG: NAD kinase [Candidatus Nanopelagicales bacterium]
MSGSEDPRPAVDLEHASEQRAVFVLPHVFRDDAREFTRQASEGLVARGVEVLMRAEDAALIGSAAITSVESDQRVSGCELVMTFGGDGTILRGAELARGHDVPLLGVNLGHMGFLAESEPEDLPSVIAAVVNREYTVEYRLAVDLTLVTADGERTSGWALNDVSLEKSSRARMIEVMVAVDDQPLSTWACDGVVCSTPTGSTAYAWSAGGPVVWPDVEALLVVPISAHALFSRPLVISPNSEIDIELTADSPPAILWCDGRRLIEVPSGSRIEIRRSDEPVALARVHPDRFSDRLVAKFALPVSGWRGRRDPGGTQ